MTGYLLKGCAAVVTGNEVLRDVDLLTDGPAIKAIGRGSPRRGPR